VGVASLVLGIIGLILAIIPGLWLVAIPIAVIALILGIVGRKSAASNNAPTGTATAGLVLGAIGTVLGIAMWVACQMCVAKVKSDIEKGLNDPKLQKEFEDAFKKAMDDAKKEQEKPPAE
jgi:lysylphosphatidylglycerol synthetase-like protein (DUF2156 family)